MEHEEREKWLLAGRIGKEVREYGIKLARPGESLLSIAKELEKKTKELGGIPAFPPNLSVNSVAAHYTPKVSDETVLKEGDVLKIDVGACVDGFLSDTASTLIVGKNDDRLVRSSKEALEKAINSIKPGGYTDETSNVIEETIRSYGFSPVVNLGGHGLGRYDLHSGFISNVSIGGSKRFPEEGVIAIEPFSTNGGGYVIESSDVQIMMLKAKKAVRSRLGRELMDFVSKEYATLPFAKRWIIERFGQIADMELRSLSSAGCLHEFAVLKEKDGGLVSQAEHTILIDNGEVIVTTI